ncbi:MAG: lasso peptide biosynthesis B2 protein [Bryobacteraceae bacterium]
MLLDVAHDRLYSLDRVGAEMWRLSTQGLTPDQIASVLSQKYGRPKAEILDDVAKFLHSLEARRLLVRSFTHLRRRPRVPNVHVPDELFLQIGLQPPPALIVRALHHLLASDFVLQFRGFERLYGRVAETPCRPIHPKPGVVPLHVSALEFACTWYPRETRCLHRSAALTCLLRCEGVPAFLVIGIRRHPFRAHAWVEVGDRVVNDKTGVRSVYEELDRC